MANAISLQEAINLGVFNEDQLNQFAEWKDLDSHVQYQYICQAIINRRKQLRLQWAKMANQPNYSKKPLLREAQKKVEEALRILDQEEELLMVKYAGV